jgi:hypothetical protein
MQAACNEDHAIPHQNAENEIAGAVRISTYPLLSGMNIERAQTKTGGNQKEAR